MSLRQTFLFMFLLVVSIPALTFAERLLSLSEALNLALEQNPELHLEKSKIEEAEETAKSMASLFGPKLSAEGNLLLWDSALPFKLDLPTSSSTSSSSNITPEQIQQMNLTPDEMVTLAKYSDLLAVFPKLTPLMFSGFSNMRNIRDQVTGQISLTLAQPLTPLLQINAGYQATKLMSESASLDFLGKRDDVMFKTSEAYLQLLQTMQFTEVAKTGVEQVAKHIEQAQKYYSAGLIGKQEVLKAQVELARANEQLIKARYGSSLAESALAMHLGLSIDEKITPTEKVADPPPKFEMSLEDCLRQAQDKRNELKAMGKKIEAAEQNRSRTKWSLLPQLVAAGTYQRTHGQGTFSPESSYFVGGILKWDIWEWGRTNHELKAASAKRSQAEIGQHLIKQGIYLQTKKAYLDLKQSEEALEVARTSITKAEEDFRIEQKRFESNTNTGTDVLDAQLALTRAKLSYTTALYGYYIAQASLKRAIGQL